MFDEVWGGAGNDALVTFVQNQAKITWVNSNDINSGNKIKKKYIGL